MSNRLADCQRVVGYHFSDANLLEIALTHSSVRSSERECNERQEFLGDSVLGLVITEELYKRLPDQAEGELTRIKSAVVSRGALYRVSIRLGLPRFIEIAKGVGKRDELPVSVTANLVESIIGAIYLDAGFFPAREFILRHLGVELDDVLHDRVSKNYKSLLQHEAQQILRVTPVYRTIDEGGPDHRKSFVIAAMLRGKEYGRASGINKKEAEQEAARIALEALVRRGRGRRLRSDDGPRGDGRGEGRGDGRGDGRGRGGGRGGDRRGRSSYDDSRAPAPIRQSSDEDAWRSWAERQAATSGGAVAGSAAPAPLPAPTPHDFVVGPESDEGFVDHPAPSGEAAPRADGAPSEAPPAAPREGEQRFDEGDGRRRRRGRGRGRGGRGRGPREDDRPRDAGAAPSEPPMGQPADSSAAPSGEGAVAGSGPTDERPESREASEGREPSDGREPQARLDRYADDRPPPAGRAPRQPRQPREPRSPSRSPRSRDPEPASERPMSPPPALSSPTALPPSSQSDAPPAPPPPARAPAPRPPPVRKAAAPAAPTGPTFGAGVAAEGAAPAPAPAPKAVKRVGAVKASKKAPKVDAPPADKGGFGTGIA